MVRSASARGKAFSDMIAGGCCCDGGYGGSGGGAGGCSSCGVDLDNLLCAVVECGALGAIAADRLY